jgi:hypothetical protein
MEQADRNFVELALSEDNTLDDIYIRDDDNEEWQKRLKSHSKYISIHHIDTRNFEEGYSIKSSEELKPTNLQIKKFIEDINSSREINNYHHAQEKEVWR